MPFVSCCLVLKQPVKAVAASLEHVMKAEACQPFVLPDILFPLLKNWPKCWSPGHLPALFKGLK